MYIARDIEYVRFILFYFQAARSLLICDILISAESYQRKEKKKDRERERENTRFDFKLLI